MTLYIKALTLDENRNLTSCHGGSAVWEFSNPRSDVPEGQPRTVYVDADTVHVRPGGQPCRAGALHALRIRDLPYWLGTNYAVVEMIGAFRHDNKVYGDNQRLVRIADFDGLDMLVRFAEYCAEQGEDYDDAAAARWIATQFPAGFLDGVEE